MTQDILNSDQDIVPHRFEEYCLVRFNELELGYSNSFCRFTSLTLSNRAMSCGEFAEACAEGMFSALRNKGQKDYTDNYQGLSTS